MESYMFHPLEMTLETKRLLLLPMLATDMDALHLIFTDPKVTASFGGDLFSREQMDVDGQSVAELGYHFRSAYWNQGFATEAAAGVRDYAFGVLQLPQLISLIRVGNLASQRVAEKMGMRLVEEFSRYQIRYWRCAIQCP
jgi:RimJ/RimL family protein N-acetyltransferase